MSAAWAEPWSFATLLDLLTHNGEFPALIAVGKDQETIVSCASLAARVRHFAEHLRSRGVVAGEIVALLAPNGIAWVVARLAIGAVGAVALALDDLATEAELASALRDSACRRVVTAEAHAATLRMIDPGLGLIPLPDAHVSEPGAPREPAAFRLLPRLGPEAPAMLVYTSGTTGAPKGFVLSYGHIWANIRALVAEQLVERGDRVLLPLPLHHVYPLVVGLLTPLACGAAVVFPQTVAGPQLMQALTRAQVSAIIGVPRLYAAIVNGLQTRLQAGNAMQRLTVQALLALSIRLRRDLGINAGRFLLRRLRARIGPDLRLLVSGGARLESDVLWRLVGLGFDVRSGYGLAETASIFTGNLPGCERLESEGQPFQGGELRIAGPDEDGVGEIELRGPNVFAGYRNNPEANREAFTPDGWFRTGDLGRVDRDGFLYVLGRRKETITLGGGRKVHPEALEALYGDSPYIREIAVLEHHGGLVALVLPELAGIRLGPSTHIDDAIRVALTARAQQLPAYQRLAGYALVRETLPRTRLGKYQRFLLPALYERAAAAPPAVAKREISREDRDLLAHPTARHLYELLQARYAGKPVHPDASPLLDLGIDSLEWIALSLEIEHRLGLHFSDAEMAGVVRLADLLRLAVRKAGAPAPPPAAPPGPTAERWIAPTGLCLTVLGLGLYGLNRLLMRTLFRVRLKGAAALPPRGPYVLVANHASDLDPLLLASVLGYRRIRQLYWGGEGSRLFVHPWQRPLMRALHVFPLDERAPAEGLALAKAVLQRGNGLIWFPESWRSPDGSLQRFLPGIGWLLAQTRVPALPVYIAGSFAALPRHRRWPRLHPVCITVGEAFTPGKLNGLLAAPESSHQRVADTLRSAVAELGASAGSDRPD